MCRPVACEKSCVIWNMVCLLLGTAVAGFFLAPPLPPPSFTVRLLRHGRPAGLCPVSGGSGAPAGRHAAASFACSAEHSIISIL